MTLNNHNKETTKNEVIGLGVDILEVKRIKDLIDKQGDKFLTRIFTPKEINYCQSKKRALESFAVRFSAKEAFIKAIESDYNIAYKSIEIDKKENKKPKVNLSGKALLAAEEKNVTDILISLSHEKNYVTANIILKGRIK
ncbi:MAG TPA: holo-ACP synthase [Halanaerobiales bacterium]|nr:holo-ACP synthase [Halanaerobiales bacterium]